MKLTARKSMVAMGTALAMSLTPVAVPTMAPTAFAVSEAQFAKNLAKLNTEFSVAKDRQARLEKEASSITLQAADTDARGHLDSANNHLIDSKSRIENLSTYANTEGKFALEATDDNDGMLKGWLEGITEIRKSQDKATVEIKNAKSAKFVCPGAEESDGTDGSSGSSMDNFTSSGNRVVVENGKRKCVSNSTFMTDKLTKLVTVLGTIFTLITTVTKISDVFMKNNPLVPPAA